jgi:hypothetical protein
VERGLDKLNEVKGITGVLRGRARRARRKGIAINGESITKEELAVKNQRIELQHGSIAAASSETARKFALSRFVLNEDE